MGHTGRSEWPRSRAAAWIAWISLSTWSQVAAMSWCIAGGSSPSTKYGL